MKVNIRETLETDRATLDEFFADEEVAQEISTPERQKLLVLLAINLSQVKMICCCKIYITCMLIIIFQQR